MRNSRVTRSCFSWQLFPPPPHIFIFISSFPACTDYRRSSPSLPPLLLSMWCVGGCTSQWVYCRAMFLCWIPTVHRTQCENVGIMLVPGRAHVSHSLTRFQTWMGMEWKRSQANEWLGWEDVCDMKFNIPELEFYVYDRGPLEVPEGQFQDSTGQDRPVLEKWTEW